MKGNAEQFNRMLDTLRLIARGYHTPDSLRKSSQRLYGLDYEEALEFAYDNIQSDAARCIKGVRRMPEAAS